MKKFFVLKSLLMLCALFGGVGNAIANDYDYEWVKVTKLSEVAIPHIQLMSGSPLDTTEKPLNDEEISDFNELI